jgi:hypothetical protein
LRECWQGPSVFGGWMKWAFVPALWLGWFPERYGVIPVGVSQSNPSPSGILPPSLGLQQPTYVLSGSNHSPISAFQPTMLGLNPVRIQQYQLHQQQTGLTFHRETTQGNNSRPEWPQFPPPRYQMPMVLTATPTVSLSLMRQQPPPIMLQQLCNGQNILDYGSSPPLPADLADVVPDLPSHGSGCGPIEISDWPSTTTYHNLQQVTDLWHDNGELYFFGVRGSVRVLKNPSVLNSYFYRIPYYPSDNQSINNTKLGRWSLVASTGSVPVLWQW